MWTRKAPGFGFNYGSRIGTIKRGTRVTGKGLPDTAAICPVVESKANAEIVCDPAFRTYMYCADRSNVICVGASSTSTVLGERGVNVPDVASIEYSKT